MKVIANAVIIASLGWAQAVCAQPVRWSTFTIPQTGTSVDIPSSVFDERAGGSPEGVGARFQTRDHRANMTIEGLTNEANDTPAAYLAKKGPPPGIQYKRVTSRFFVVSSTRGDAIWYDRCNFSGRFIHCVLINYPAREKRAWDDIVTRMSYSLSGR